MMLVRIQVWECCNYQEQTIEDQSTNRDEHAVKQRTNKKINSSINVQDFKACVNTEL